MSKDENPKSPAGISAAGGPPQTLGDALDELAANGFAEEVSATREGMQMQTERFMRALLGR